MHLAIANNTYFAIATELVVDTARLVKKVQHRVAWYTGITARLIHKTGHKNGYGLHTLQIRIHIHIIRINATHRLTNTIVELAVTNPLHRNRANAWNKNITLRVDR